jgi:hypothetical protein
VPPLSDDGERWSFIFRTEGVTDFLYCPWWETEDREFDGTIEGLDLSWSPERIELIERGEAEPNKRELLQWRKARCRTLPHEWVAWVVPIWIENTIRGYALFTFCWQDPTYPTTDSEPNFSLALIKQRQR